MHLSGLFIYPVKSLRGFAVSVAEVDALGLVGDRRFLVVDENNRFLTQRALPQMARIATKLDPRSLELSAEGAGTIAVARASDPATPLRTVTVWKSGNLLAEDCGDAPAAWLSDFLRTKCRLVRIGAKFRRPIFKPPFTQPGDVVSFADGFPFLVVGEASLGHLNDRLVAQGEEAVPMNRFRPNLVVNGCPPFAEDTWPRVRIGEIVLRAGGPCARCIVTTTDQLTGERGREPLRTLATFRRDASDPTNVNFGQNLIPETKTGTLRVGDVVTVLSA
ncbi:MAG: MOSC N-terminal beta barrel domain-containing protein [Opitutaceae bacterium]